MKSSKVTVVIAGKGMGKGKKEMPTSKMKKGGMAKAKMSYGGMAKKMAKGGMSKKAC